MSCSLVVVGVGIKFIAHLSVEARAYIAQSDRVLYLVNDPLMKEWIETLNPKSESLEPLYVEHNLRSDSYNAISNYILESLFRYKHVCIVMYGHPAVFAQPALAAVKQAKAKGIYAKVLPAISAEDCLFADLLIDPASNGCQSYDATDFLIYDRRFDVNSHLILWQVGVIGALNHVKENQGQHAISILTEYLKKFYPLEHQVTLYEAAQYPSIDPRIELINLEKLSECKLSRLTTLYVPPLGETDGNQLMINALRMK